MSYDIYLKEKSTGETIELPVKHVMTGGTYCADYDELSGVFTVRATTEAWLNVTYNSLSTIMMLLMEMTGFMVRIEKENM